jgi:hypothetical protein
MTYMGDLKKVPQDLDIAGTIIKTLKKSFGNYDRDVVNEYIVHALEEFIIHGLTLHCPFLLEWLKYKVLSTVYALEAREVTYLNSKKVATAKLLLKKSEFYKSKCDDFFSY